MARTLMAHSPGLLELLLWSLQFILCIIHPGWLELTLARTIFHGSKPVWAIEVLLYILCNWEIMCKTTNWCYKWAATCDFQQCGILTSVDSNEPVWPPFKLRNSKWCSVSILTLIEYSSDKQRLWSDWAYAQADLRLCWSHIPHCWKFHVTAQIMNYQNYGILVLNGNRAILQKRLA